MKQFKLKLLICFFLFSSVIFSIGLKPVHNTEGGILSGVCLSHLGNGYAAFYNPAVTPFLNNHNIMFGYYKPYQVPDIQYSSVESFIPVGNLSIPVHFNMVMVNEYRESQLSFSYARKILDNAAIGIQLNSYQVWVSRYGNYFAGSMDLGFAAKLFPAVNVGMVVTNLFKFEEASVDMGIKPAMKMEVSYSPIPNSSMAFQVNQNFSNEFGYGFSINHKINKNFHIMLGLLPEDEIWSGGIHLSSNKLSLIYGLHFHPVLEETHLIGFNYSW